MDSSLNFSFSMTPPHYILNKSDRGHALFHIVNWSKNDAYSTPCSDAVTYQPTDGAQTCLSSVSGREPECSGWYGRRHKLMPTISIYFKRATIIS